MGMCKDIERTQVSQFLSTPKTAFTFYSESATKEQIVSDEQVLALYFGGNIFQLIYTE